MLIQIKVGVFSTSSSAKMGYKNIEKKSTRSGQKSYEIKWSQRPKTGQNQNLMKMGIKKIEPARKRGGGNCRANADAYW